MKPDLKRIEEALHQLADRNIPDIPLPVSRPISLTDSLIEAGTGSATPILDAAEQTVQPIIELPALPILRSGNSAGPKAPLPQDSERASGNMMGAKVPTLPRVKTPSLSSHRNAENPSLAMSLLKEMEITVAGWQEELQQVLRQIQDLYLEGPIVDGWLESYAHQDGEAPTFRHADIDCLMNYVEKMRDASVKVVAKATMADSLPPISHEVVAAGYRLCGLNEDGQLWFRHCPAEQVPAVSLAIARYQRLRILLSRKQHLESRLSQLAQTLIGLHGQWNGA